MIITFFKNLFLPRDPNSEVEHIKTIAAGTISYAINSAVSVLTSLITIPLLIRSLGQEQYGLFILLGSMVAFLGLTDIGLLNTLINKISYLKAEDKKEEINRVINGALTFLALFFAPIIVIFSFILFWGNFPFASIFNIKLEYETISLILLFFLGLAWIVNNIFSGVLRSSYSGLNKISSYQLANLVYTVIFSLAYIIFLLSNRSITAIVLFLFIFAIIRFIALFVFFKRIFPSFILNLRFKSIGAIKSLLRYSPLMIFFGAVAIMIGKSDTLIVSHYLGLSAVAIYGIAFKLFALPADALKITDSAFPSVAALYQDKNFVMLKKIYSRMLRLHFIIRFAILSVILIYSKNIISLWLGDKFFGGGLLMLSFFIYMMIFAWTAPHGILANALFLYKQQFFPAVAYLILTFLFYFIFVPIFGLAGIPLAIGLANLLTNGFYLAYLAKKHIGVDPLKELIKIIGMVVFPFGALMLLHYTNVFFIHGLIVKIVFALLSVAIFWFLMFLFCLEKEEKNYAFRWLRTNFES